MRRVLTFVGMLAVSGLVAAVPFSLARAGGGAERHDPLAVADRLEQEGRARLEQGHKAEGAKLLSKAWAIRAEVFAHADADRPQPPEGQAREKPQVPPELEALQARIAELKAASNAAEREGKELQEAGKPDRAEAKMQESGRLWKEAEALREKLEAVRGERKRQELPVASRADASRAELKLEIENARAMLARQLAEAERQAAAGNENATRQARVRVEELARVVSEMEARLGGVPIDVSVAPRFAPSPTDPVRMEAARDQGPDRMAALAQQLEKLMRRMNEMQERLTDLQRRLEKGEKDK